MFFGRPDEVGGFIHKTLGYMPPPHINPADLMIEVRDRVTAISDAEGGVGGRAGRGCSSDARLHDPSS